MATVTNGKSPVYSGATGKYEPGTVTGGASGAGAFTVTADMGLSEDQFYFNGAQDYAGGGPTSTFWMLNDPSGDNFIHFGLGMIGLLLPGGTALLPTFQAPTFTGAFDILVQVFHWGLTNPDMNQLRIFDFIRGGGFAMTSGESVTLAGGSYTEIAAAGFDLDLTLDGITSTAGGLFLAGLSGIVRYTGAEFT